MHRAPVVRERARRARARARAYRAQVSRSRNQVSRARTPVHGTAVQPCIQHCTAVLAVQCCIQGLQACTGTYARAYWASAVHGMFVSGPDARARARTRAGNARTRARIERGSRIQGPRYPVPQDHFWDPFLAIWLERPKTTTSRRLNSDGPSKGPNPGSRFGPLF